MAKKNRSLYSNGEQMRTTQAGSSGACWRTRQMTQRTLYENYTRIAAYRIKSVLDECGNTTNTIGNERTVRAQ